MQSKLLSDFRMVAKNQKLISKEIQGYIFENENVDEKKLLLSKHEILGTPAPLVAIQIIGRRKAKRKLPSWYETTGILYPPSLNLEQSSSEATGKFKIGIIQRNLSTFEKAVDLTGGFGVDTFCFDKVFDHVVHVEPDAELQQIAKHNHQLLGAIKVQYKHQPAAEFLQQNADSVDLFYIDPSRRNKAAKVFKLADCIPDVTELLADLFKQSEYVLLKASPMLDVQQGLRELKNVKQVWVVSVDNECKELLFLVEKDFAGEALIEAVNLNANGEPFQSFDFRFSEERQLKVNVGTLCQYLYEPNASILKAGAFQLIANRYGVYKIDVNTHLYSSDLRVTDFPGRIFRVVGINPNSKQLHQLLPDGKANVVTRNYPLSPDELKKKLKLKDGGEKYVIGFSEKKGKSIVVAERIK